LPIAPVLLPPVRYPYPSSTGAQRFLVASGGCEGYATGLRGRCSQTRCSFSLLLVPREAGDDYPPLRPFSCSQVREDGHLVAYPSSTGARLLNTFLTIS
jgi:hypothetical protein